MFCCFGPVSIERNKRSWENNEAGKYGTWNMDSPKWTCASECLSMCCACVCPKKEEERDLSDLASPAEHMAVKNLLRCSTLSLCTLVFLTLVAQNVA